MAREETEESLNRLECRARPGLSAQARTFPELDRQIRPHQSISTATRLGVDASQSRLPVVIFAVLIAFSLLTALLFPHLLSTAPPYASEIRSYIPHGVILIDGNAQLVSVAANESWLGDGSSVSPYLIKGYEIDAGGAPHGVWISNTDLHFVIMECCIHNSTSAQIRFDYLVNGNVSGSELRQMPSEPSTRGAAVYGSSDCAIVGNDIPSLEVCTSVRIAISGNNLGTGLLLLDCAAFSEVRGNVFSGSHIGLEMSQSDDCLVVDNTFIDVRYGIRVLFSNRDVVTGNTFTGVSLCSIMIDESTHAYVQGNTMANGGITLSSYFDDLLSLNSHFIDESNTVAGNPVWYCKNQSGISLTSDVSSVIIVNCSDIVVRDQTFDDVYSAVFISHSQDVLVEEVEVSERCRNGISVRCSERSSVLGSHIRAFSDSVSLEMADGTEIAGNTIGGAGDHQRLLSIRDSADYLVEDNCLIGSMLIGVWTMGSSPGCFSGNSLDNLSIGMLIESEDVMLGDNTFVDCGIGAYLLSSRTTLSGNQMSGCGLMLWGHSSEITSHIIDQSNSVNGAPVAYLTGQIGGSAPPGAGQVVLASCSGVSVHGQEIGGATAGILAILSTAISIENNTCSDCWGVDFAVHWEGPSTAWSVLINCPGSGIAVVGSSGCLIANNTLTGNQMGVYASEYEWDEITFPDELTIRDNVFEGNMNGLSLEGYFHLVTRNLIANSTSYGAMLYGGGSLIFGNDFLFNNGAGTAFDPLHIQAWEQNSNKWNTSSGGNYWSDWQSPDEFEPYGIVDLPYSIDGSTGQSDFLPLTNLSTPIPEFGVGQIVAALSTLLVLMVLVSNRRQHRLG